jgi:hypothetical protein
MSVSRGLVFAGSTSADVDEFLQVERSTAAER